jgi:hypothetical protein
MQYRLGQIVSCGAVNSRRTVHFTEGRCGMDSAPHLCSGRPGYESQHGDLS